MPNLASQRAELHSPAWPQIPVLAVPGELEMTRSTSEVAVCCFCASASSRLHDLSSCSRAAPDLGIRSQRSLAFVPVERAVRRRVRRFAPLRDKVTWIAPYCLSQADGRVF